MEGIILKNSGLDTIFLYVLMIIVMRVRGGVKKKVIWGGAHHKVAYPQSSLEKNARFSHIVRIFTEVAEF